MIRTLAVASRAGRSRPRRRMAQDASTSSSACSTTAPASTPTFRRRLGRGRAHGGRGFRRRRRRASMSRSSRPTTRTSPTSARTSRASGMTRKASTRSSTCRPPPSRSPWPTSPTEMNGVLHRIPAPGSTELTRGQCKPTTIHWTYDTAALAKGTGKAITEGGGKKWFFLTADYAFGHSLEEKTSRVVTENGGEVRGHRPPSLPGDRLLVLPAAGAGLGSEGDRARQRRRRHRERDQAGLRVRHHPGRAEPRRAAVCSSPTSMRWGRRRRRACS